MSDKTGIEWTDATWNPIRGCTRVSEGCRNCYAERVAARFSGAGQPYAGLAEMTESGPRWTGKVRLVEEHLEDPLRWKKPRKIFVNSMSDLFHLDVGDDQIDRIFAVMALCPQHTFQILTKRPTRMALYLGGPHCERWHSDRREAIRERLLTDMYQAKSSIGSLQAAERLTVGKDRLPEWPLPNVWLGVSVEDQATADARIPELLKTPAAVRFISYEPALGPVNLAVFAMSRTDLHWVICGGESGPDARSMHPAWARTVRDQCQAAGVPFFFKQWGEWAEVPAIRFQSSVRSGWCSPVAHTDFAARQRSYSAEDRKFCKSEQQLQADGFAFVDRVGKAAAGRVLDGRTWDEFPKR